MEHVHPIETRDSLAAAARRRAVVVAFVAASAVLSGAAWADALAGQGGALAEAARPAAVGLAKASHTAAVGVGVGAEASATRAGVVSRPPTTPSDVNNGFILVAPITATWAASGIEMTVQDVQNVSGSTSGALQLELWATPTAPVFGQTIAPYVLGPAYAMGPLNTGFEYDSVNTGTLAPFAAPPNGCYFVTVALEELQGSNFQYVDLATLKTNGVADPGGSGFDLFAFGVPASTCSNTPPPACVPDATTACLISGRFQVKVSYTNATSSGDGSIMSFNSSRAENDESTFLYFTDPTNFEMGLKVLPACGVNNHFWVFIGGLTNQGWTVNILDTSTHNTATYTNANNHLTATTADTSAFVCP